MGQRWGGGWRVAGNRKVENGLWLRRLYGNIGRAFGIQPVGGLYLTPKTETQSAAERLEGPECSLTEVFLDISNMLTIRHPRESEDDGGLPLAVFNCLLATYTEDPGLWPVAKTGMTDVG